MQINEVKIGDIVTFKNKQGKMVKGKVIHRHDASDSAHLAGHVNVEKIGGPPSYPFTLHVSKLKPAIEEEKMSVNENVQALVQAIMNNDEEAALAAFNAAMAEKTDAALDAQKVVVANNLFGNEVVLTQEQWDGLTPEEQAQFEIIEGLKGKQHKIDANKNGKIDAHDFMILRKKRGMKEEAEGVDEAYYSAKEGRWRRDESDWDEPDEEEPKPKKTISYQHRRMAYANKPKDENGSHSVHIDGKKWKSFGSQSHASNVAKKLEAKGKKATVHKD